MSEAEGLCWWEDDGAHTGEFAACTVARIRLAAEGEVEGGLGALMRFQVAALNPGVPQPALSPAGWYWTVAVRGWWSAWTLAASPAEARLAAETAFFEGRARGIIEASSS